MKKAIRGMGTSRKALLGGAFAVVVGLGSAVTVAANAAEEIYDPSQLLAACAGEDTDVYGKADKCRFEAWTYKGFTGELQQVSGVDSNCGAGSVTRAIQWTQATTESNSVAVSTSVSATISTIFSAGVSTTFTHTWQHTEERRDTVSVEIPPKTAATVFRGAPMAKVTGRMVVNFGSRRQGHFEWYVYPTLTVPAEDQPNLSRLVSNTRPLSETELAQCPVVPGDVGQAPGETTVTLQEPSGGEDLVGEVGDPSIQHADD